MNRKQKYLSALAAFAGIAFGFSLGWQAHPPVAPAAERRGRIIREGQYEYINPILACEIGIKDAFPELKLIEKKIAKHVQGDIKAGNAENVSVYLRTLNSGRWIGINEEQEYTPASLLKVLLMMAYFKKAEENPGVLTEQFAYTREIRERGGKDSEPRVELEVGKRYTVDELIRQMIVYSDNFAMYVLLDHLSPDELREVFADLNVPVPTIEDQQSIGFVSVQTYSIVFRVLYGATYLNRAMSERALALLREVDFRDGINRGLPEEVPVVHKFGSYVLPPSVLRGNTGLRELHDCGIVYYPEHPYLFCMMTRGADLAKLAEVIAGTSREAYAAINEFFKDQP